MNDPVHSPSHYNADSGIECIDAMRAAFTPEEVAAFCKLNAFKYIWRAGKKGSAKQDMEKAQVYLDWASEFGAPEETGVDSAALMQEIQQRAYAEFLAGQERAGFVDATDQHRGRIVDLDPTATASVGSPNESLTDRSHPVPDSLRAVADRAAVALRGSSGE